MGRRRARGTKDQEMAAPSSPDTKKRKSDNGALGGAGVCDDVLDNIFARLPTRTAVASMVLSKHHHHLICSPEFRNRHFHLGAPLPNPNIAYLVTERNEHKDDEFQSFHIAGAGLNSNAPMRTLAGERLHEMKYVNACNGILLFAGDTNSKTHTCILWNPAIAEKEVIVPYAVNQDPDDLFKIMTGYDYSILGLGYGPRSKTYKLLLSLRLRLSRVLQSAPPQNTYDRELLVYTRRGRGATTFYIHAFDIDNETIIEIDVPGSEIYPGTNLITSGLMQLSGRPCLVKKDGGQKTLWILTEDHTWEQRYAFKVGDDLIYRPIEGVWDHNGVLVLYLYNKGGRYDKLFLYQDATNKKLKKNLSRKLKPGGGGSDYSFCWGYMPTLVSPRSIVGELGQDVEHCLDHTVDIMKELKPGNERDRRNEQKSTPATVCFMEYLIRVMEKLPQNLQDEIEMSLFDS
ncbi:hypothetical protein PR202_ga19198 [Eleusine coracana subsp. coracana]|uniref:F-box protein n=1 Tax=Eleusine coracana subsp. coracana TaxID=191504 RepID=A0AAV5CV01_ELECO|nr:hypothetical protein PR202_ga19198 [Eleusine coracana subsp. coracana]